MDKYCVDVVVTYNYYDDKFHDLNMMHNVDLSIVDAEDKTTEISDFFYKSELIAVFKLKEFCPVLVSDAIQNITDILKEDSGFLECIQIACGKIFSEDIYHGLVVLFAYDYFCATHRCICEFLTEGKIKPETLSILKNILST